MGRKCRKCSEGYRCRAHVPHVEPTTPEQCEHKWWRFVGVLLKCMGCGSDGRVLRQSGV